MISNFLEYFIFLFFVFLTRIFSYKSYKYIAGIVGFIFFYFIPIRKKVVINNLKKAFPELSQKEINEIAKKNYKHFVNLFLEYLSLSHLKKEKIVKYVNSFDHELLREKKPKDKACFFLTAHFGNWELGAVYTGIMLNEPLQVLAKKQRNTYVSDWMNKTRERFGNRVITLGASVRDMYKAVKSNFLIGVVGDQRGPREGPKVKLFNQSTSVYTGTAAIALKTNTPILVIFFLKNEQGAYDGFIEEIKFDNLQGTLEEKELMITQEYMRLLEKYIRLYPEQWFWMHNIWKY